ncbi:SRPBCC family protein [Nocardioides sp. JQ2195]|uniref:SRPBCC family protein n=1 Tax=Nocardioides sp. JQ2195 TaxID=2592334 RepID=UPI00143E8566|nr:SRPBCC family protein [Nocardioides sp. JQ2195]QIX26067.1 SRPBCC family protein [Nocardioides sp. JQ2195]
MSADRELRAETIIEAPVERVWAVLSDLSRMPELSDETVRMLPLKGGGLRVGQWYLGINRRKLVVWPTRNVVAALEPRRLLSWDTTSSGARWIYELEADGGRTRVVHRRPVLGRLTGVSRLFAPLALGGTDEHADELEAGMARTLGRLKAAVEG